MIRHERSADGRVAVVTIDRPQRRNAVDHDTLVALRAAVREAGADTEARVVVLTGAGPAFCAGADLTGVEDAGFADVLRDVLVALTTVPKPVIAAVDGPALGAGTQLAAACDLRVATAGSTFGIPAARLGLMVDAWTVERLVHLLGGSLARGVLVGGLTMSGAEAARVGFVHRDGALPEALQWAGTLAGLAPLTLAGHKVTLEAQVPEPVTGGAVAEAFTRAWSSEDYREGLAAFAAKRPPEFRGR